MDAGDGYADDIGQQLGDFVIVKPEGGAPGSFDFGKVMSAVVEHDGEECVWIQWWCGEGKSEDPFLDTYFAGRAAKDQVGVSCVSVCPVLTDCICM